MSKKYKQLQINSMVQKEDGIFKETFQRVQKESKREKKGGNGKPWIWAENKTKHALRKNIPLTTLKR